jgi:hypothetical protein
MDSQTPVEIIENDPASRPAKKKPRNKGKKVAQIAQCTVDEALGAYQGEVKPEQTTEGVYIDKLDLPGPLSHRASNADHEERSKTSEGQIPDNHIPPMVENDITPTWKSALCATAGSPADAITSPGEEPPNESVPFVPSQSGMSVNCDEPADRLKHDSQETATDIVGGMC